MWIYEEEARSGEKIKEVFRWKCMTAPVQVSVCVRNCVSYANDRLCPAESLRIFRAHRFCTSTQRLVLVGVIIVKITPTLHHSSVHFCLHSHPPTIVHAKWHGLSSHCCAYTSPPSVMHWPRRQRPVYWLHFLLTLLAERPMSPCFMGKNSFY